MSSGAQINLTLCICGLPESAHGPGKSTHPYTPPSWQQGTRDTQKAGESERDGHYTLKEQRVVTIAKPAAGVDVVATVPANARWKVWSMFATLVTDAVVNNRVPHVVITDGPLNDTVHNVPANNNQVAGATVNYSAGAGVFGVSFDNAVVMVLPVELDLLQKWTIGFKTTNLDAGDQWSALALVVTETLYF